MKQHNNLDRTVLSKKILTILVVLFGTNLALAAEEKAENASNPLAAVSNTDIRLKTFDLENGDRHEFFLDGATMLNAKLKLKYEAHWWDTDVSGKGENG